MRKKPAYLLYFLLFFAFGACPSSLFAQQPNLILTYRLPDTLFVCGTDTLFIDIKNTGGPLASGADMNAALPEGFAYVPLSVTGALEQNTADLQSPHFRLPGIAGNGNLTVAFLLHADCEAGRLLDAGVIFTAQLVIIAPGFNLSVSTPPIRLETGSLLIQSVTPAILEGEKGDTLQRIICIKNTRPGKISQFHVEDIYQPGVEMSIPQATIQTPGPSSLSADFNSAFFQSTGNNDQWLDQDESVCFTEQVIITDCGFPEHLNASLLIVGWGCGPNDLCRFDSSLTYIRILNSTAVPDLVFEPIWSPPVSYCADQGAPMGVKITNIGNAQAKDVSVTFILEFLTTVTAIQPNSVRIRKSNGDIIPITPNVTVPSYLIGCGKPGAQKVITTIPLIEIGDSLELLFDLLYCLDNCVQDWPVVKVEYFYRKPCPVDGFISKIMQIVPDNSYVIHSKIRFSPAVCLKTGNTYPATINVVSGRLIQNDGVLNLQFYLPKGLTQDPSCPFQLGNVTPDQTSSQTAPDGGVWWNLQFNLPLPFDSAGLKLCLHYECDSTLDCNPPPPFVDSLAVVYNADCPNPCFAQLEERCFWSQTATSPVACGIGDCHTIYPALEDCLDGGGGADPDTNKIGNNAYGSWKMDVVRINYGLKDLNDDREADDGSQASGQDIRLDRYWPGDTSRVIYCAVIDSGVVEILRRYIYHEVTLSDTQSPWDNDPYINEGIRTLFTNAQNLRYIGDSVRIRYVDGSSYALRIDDFGVSDDQNGYIIYPVNTNPPTVIDVLLSQRHTFRFSLKDYFNQGLLPKPDIGPGDSIFFYTDFKMDMNYNYPSPGFTDPPMIGFRTAVSHGDFPYAWNRFPFKRMQYTGILPKVTPAVFSLRPCESSLEAQKLRFSWRVARENFFPKEVRPIGRIVEYGVTVPDDGLTFESARIRYLALQDSVNRLADIPLTFTQQPGYVSVDFSPAFTQPIDEGFQLGAQMVFAGNCHFDHPDSSKQWIGLQWNECIGGVFPHTVDTLKKKLGYFAGVPDLNLITTDSVITSLTRGFEFQFTLKNPVVSPAEHSWVAAVSASGEVTDIQLYRLPSNQQVTPQNGIFNLGLIPGFNSRDFLITGNFVNCAADSLMVIYGWDCAPLTDLSQAYCHQDTYWVKLTLEKPELEVNIEYEPELVSLCDTSEYFIFQVYNTNFGAVYELFGTAQLPDGLRVLPGSSQLQYPLSSPWTNMSDPALLSGNLYRWDISNNQPYIGDNGLPGFGSAPDSNWVKIRFKTTAECRFVANEECIYGTFGQEACKAPTNTPFQPGKAIQLLGVEAEYSVQAVLQRVNAGPVSCGSEQEFLAKISITGTPSPGDSAIIFLPANARYVDGSYIPGLNAVPVPPTLEDSILRVPLPLLSGGGDLEFRFKVLFEPGAACHETPLRLQTRIRAQAFCPTLGGNCDVFISTAEYTLLVQVEPAGLTIGNFQVTQKGNITIGSVRATNSGSEPLHGAYVQLWFDQDGSQTVSAGDQLLQTLPLTNDLAPGASTTLEGSFVAPAEPACGIIAVAPALENCLCADQIIALDRILVEHDTMQYCVADQVLVGVDSLDGFHYQWVNSPGVQCLDCAHTTYTPDPNIPVGGLHILQLEAEKDGCKVLNIITLSFGSEASIASGPATLCKGEPFTLEVTPTGISYDWQGPGITNPGAATQTVTPLEDAVYTVWVTFIGGCSAVATATLTVNAPDTTQLPVITACEGEIIPLFQQQVEAVAGAYQQDNTNQAGCDSLVFQTVVVLQKSATQAAMDFCKGDTLFVFDTIPVLSGGVICRTFKGINGCDSTHCITTTAYDPPALPVQDTVFTLTGQPVVLSNPAGFVDYVWNPAVEPPCLHCPSVELLYPEAGFYQYTVTIVDNHQCSDEIVWRVVVTPPCDPKNVKMPTAFTPNNDGFNDLFRPVEAEGEEVVGRLTVYDRWGEIVYENFGGIAWDGTINGIPATSDVYVYIIEVICNGEPLTRAGEITLLR